MGGLRGGDALKAKSRGEITGLCVAGPEPEDKLRGISAGNRRVKRRAFLSLLGLSALSVPLAGTPAGASLKDGGEPPRKRQKTQQTQQKPQKKKFVYKGRKLVDFPTDQKPGTIIINTHERALYQVLPDGKALRYMVAVGKEGFTWSGVARVGLKRVNPKWTPPPEMIARTPKYAKWANGMPGGIPENPLGVRALYLFTKKGDTGFRIHGTNAPSSIGTAASSGCIRMLNQEVVELYDATPVGTKVIVK